MLDAIRRGDIAEATYRQNQFMGFTLDQRLPDRLRDAKDMVIMARHAVCFIRQTEPKLLFLFCLNCMIVYVLPRQFAFI